MTKNKPAGKAKKNIARALLIVGLILSIFSLIGSILLLLVYIGLFLIVAIVLLVVIGVVLGTVLGLFFYINFFGLFFTALFGGTSYEGIWPEEIKTFFEDPMWEDIGIGALIYSIGLPIITIMIVTSFLAMIYAIVALSCLNHSKSKKGGITGGVFALLSAFTGAFCIFEFVGGIFMFIINDAEYMVGHEPEPYYPDRVIYVRKRYVPKQIEYKG